MSIKIYRYFGRMASDAKKPMKWIRASLKIVDSIVENAIHRVFIEIYVCAALIQPDFRGMARYDRYMH